MDMKKNIYKYVYASLYQLINQYLYITQKITIYLWDDYSYSRNKIHSKILFIRWVLNTGPDG